MRWMLAGLLVALPFKHYRIILRSSWLDFQNLCLLHLLDRLTVGVQYLFSVSEALLAAVKYFAKDAFDFHN